MNIAKNDSVKLSFHGAAKTVTGSRHLIELNSSQVLIDCGLFQGVSELRKLNWEKPKFDPKEISAIVLTHAHLDHTGYLPVICRDGFRRDIFCNKATSKLVEVLLKDAVKLQEEEADFRNKTKTTKHLPAKPLFNSDDVEQVLKQIVVVDSNSSFTAIVPKLEVKFFDAGHILGSTCLTVKANGRTIGFSGDIGRYDSPVIRDPRGLEVEDLLVCEATYGDKLHSKGDALDELEKIVRASISRGKPLLIPAFTVGRTQTLIFLLSKLEREKRIPILPVYIDSPMAINVTKMYSDFSDQFDKESLELLRSGIDPLSTANTIYCNTTDDSKSLNGLSGMHIIISASGMVNGGRILHHMKRLLPDPDVTVLFVGFQAEGTRGRTIQSKTSEVKIFGERVSVNCHIETISELSAHADSDELVKWLKSCNGVPKIVKIVHAEENPGKTFASRLRKEFNLMATAAEYRESITI